MAFGLPLTSALIGFCLGILIGLLEGTVLSLLYRRPFRPQRVASVSQNALAGLLAGLLLGVFLAHPACGNFFSCSNENDGRVWDFIYRYLTPRLTRTLGLLLGAFNGFWLAAVLPLAAVRFTASSTAPLPLSPLRRLTAATLAGALTGILLGWLLQPSIMT